MVQSTETGRSLFEQEESSPPPFATGSINRDHLRRALNIIAFGNAAKNIGEQNAAIDVLNKLHLPDNELIKEINSHKLLLIIDGQGKQTTKVGLGAVIGFGEMYKKYKKENLTSIDVVVPIRTAIETYMENLDIRILVNGTLEAREQAMNALLEKGFRKEHITSRVGMLPDSIDFPRAKVDAAIHFIHTFTRSVASIAVNNTRAHQKELF